MDNNKGMNSSCPYRNPYSRTSPQQYNNIPHKHVDNFVVGMAFVPWQTWNNVSEPPKGLRRGTIFPDLDKPFEGGCCR